MQTPLALDLAAFSDAKLSEELQVVAKYTAKALVSLERIDCDTAARSLIVTELIHLYPQLAPLIKDQLEEMFLIKMHKIADAHDPSNTRVAHITGNVSTLNPALN